MRDARLCDARLPLAPSRAPWRTWFGLKFGFQFGTTPPKKYRRPLAKFRRRTWPGVGVMPLADAL